MGIIVAITADHHANSTMGVCPPQFELDDGGTYTANRTQRWLWDCWRLFWTDVEQLKQTTGYQVLSVWNGDLAEGDMKARTHQVISRNKSTTLRLVRSVIERPIQLSDWALFLRGTPAHVGKSSWIDEEIAQDCDIAIRNGEAASWYAWRGMVGKLPLDIQHHVRLGSDPWTVANPLGKLAYQVEMDCYRKRQPLPLVIRSHRHTFADTENNYPVRVIVTGAWQGVPEYLYRSPLPPEPDTGGYIVRVDDDGAWTVTTKKYPMRTPKMQTLPPLTG
jgi:hypothetical protein